jgi:allantoate deiminase
MRANEGLVATVGEAEVVKGATNIVPGRARFSLDVRSLDEELVSRAVDDILGAGRAAAKENGCELDAQETKRLDPAPMAPEILEAQRAEAKDLGLDAPEMPSLAGHDAMTLTRAGVPCGMVFVRSAGGISHSPDEDSSKDDCALGAELLVRTALARAREI